MRSSFLKKIHCFLIIFFAVLILIPLPSLAQEWWYDEKYIDQAASAEDMVSIRTQHYLYKYEKIAQVFRPKTDVLTGAEVYIRGTFFNQKLTLTIYDLVEENNEQPITETTQKITGSGWQLFQFDPALTVIPDRRYALQLSTESKKISWVYFDDNPYLLGLTVLDEKEMRDQDFAFRIYGYNIGEAEPAIIQEDKQKTDEDLAPKDQLAPAAASLYFPELTQSNFILIIMGLIVAIIILGVLIGFILWQKKKKGSTKPPKN